MRKRTLAILGVVALLAAVLAASGAPVAAQDGIAKKAAKGLLQIPRIHTTKGFDREAPALSGALVEAAKEALRNEQDEESGERERSTLGVAGRSLGCSARNSAERNVRVNQDCTFRRQAEEIIKVNPANSKNLIAGTNDSRIGFNHCGFDFSVDGGKSWGDGIPPFFQRINSPPAGHTIRGGGGTFHTYDAASDPALAFDSQGRAFYSCVLFDVFSDASALLVTSSPEGAGGSFYNNVPASGRRFVVVEDNNPGIFHDKEFITADAFPTSPNRDNVYVTWTVFFFECPLGVGYCQSPIFGAMSTDHAQTWSRPELISGTSETLCFFGNFFNPALNPHACNFDQGSDPIVLPNGDLVLVFNNGNTAADNPNNQQLSVRCRPTGSSTAGTAHLNCGAPSKVGDDVVVDTPLCDFGRGPEQCIPGAFIRTNDFPRLAVNRATGHLFAAWQDFRSDRELDIQLAMSTDGGSTWKGAKAPVNPDQGRDHYMPAIDVVANDDDGDGDHVAVSYFRTDQVPNEAALAQSVVFTPGVQPGVQAEPSDYFLAGGRRLGTPFADKRVARPFPPPDGIQAGFNGDYSGLVVVGDTAHPIWSDTRNLAVAGQSVVHDEDVFTDALEVPDNRGDEEEDKDHND